MSGKININVKPPKLRLCCQINGNDIGCSFCRETFCIECGGAYGAAQHFLINMCKKRFFPWEIKWANKCYTKRLDDLKKSRKNVNPRDVGMGDCIVCSTYNRYRPNDRYKPDELRNKYWANNTLSDEHLWTSRTIHPKWREMAEKILQSASPNIL